MIAAPRQVICAGNLVFDIMVRPIETVQFETTTWVESIEQHMGGNGANTSFALARLGVPVALHGWVGPDDFGCHLRHKLQASGVNVDRLATGSASTATTVALVNPSGARAFLHQPGVSLEAFHDPLHFDPTPATHFHLANLFSTSGLRRTSAGTLRSARDAGFSTSLDTGWDARGEWMDVLGPVLPFVDLLFINETEGHQLAGTTDEAAIGRFFLDRGVGSVILKLGARGCVLFDAGAPLAIPGFRVPVVDTTGAGDCFAGGFLSGLHHGLTVRESARFANAVGALTIQKLGATDGLCSYADTLRWMAGQQA